MSEILIVELRMSEKFCLWKFDCTLPPHALPHPSQPPSIQNPFQGPLPESISADVNDLLKTQLQVAGMLDTSGASITKEVADVTLLHSVCTEEKGPLRGLQVVQNCVVAFPVYASQLFPNHLASPHCPLRIHTWTSR